MDSHRPSRFVFKNAQISAPKPNFIRSQTIAMGAVIAVAIWPQLAKTQQPAPYSVVAESNWKMPDAKGLVLGSSDQTSLAVLKAYASATGVTSWDGIVLSGNLTFGGSQSALPAKVSKASVGTVVDSDHDGVHHLSTVLSGLGRLGAEMRGEKA